MDLLKKRTWLVALLLVWSSVASPQNAYTFFESYEPYELGSSGKLDFRFDNANFFKNNEYKGYILEGYTITGAWIRPKLTYYPDDKIRVELGGHVMKYNGRDEYFNLSPWFTVQYQPLSNLTLILGNLDNNRNHRLLEPVYEPERFLTAAPEAGLQIKYKSRIIDLDTWIDWQQLILEGDPFKEHFEFGLSSIFNLYRTAYNEFSLPFFITSSHTGGEIDSNPALSQSFMSFTSGLSFNRSMSGTFFNGWGTNDYLSLCTEPTEEPVFNTGQGWGTYLTAYLSSRFGVITGSYWHGHNYFVPQGGYIFQNLTRPGNILIEDNELVGLKYHLDKEIFPSTHFGVMLDFYYDTINKKQLSSQGLYLILNFGLSLRKADQLIVGLNLR